MTTERLMKKHICMHCGYIYDPEAGDPAKSVPAGTAFEDLPEPWVCPICYAPREQFEPLD